MRSKGRLLNWNDAKAFGFIAPNDGSEHVFIHKTAFSNRSRIPRINDVITFSTTKDKQGRHCAANATFSGEVLIKKQPKSKSNFSIYLSLLFLTGIVVAFVLGRLPINLLFVYCIASMLTFFTYAFDKSKAKHGKWRTSENTLHILSLAGGWPGAAIAQQTLRHKSQKREFRITFWLTVMVNCGALAWLMSSQGEQLMGMFK